jgi:hypothetical protein
MLNDWFPETTIEIDWQTFQRLPRHPACRYEYRHGHLHISGNPRYYHAALNLNRVIPRPNPENDPRFRLLEREDWPHLAEVFADAFSNCEPLVHLKSEARLAAAASLLEKTSHAGFGPLVEAASFGFFPDGKLAAAVLITLIPAESLSDFTSPGWLAPAPADAVQEGWGQPHLTWIFVSTARKRRGIANRLLIEAAQALGSLGYSSLASTFLLGDHASMLWHWRVGFELLSHPGKVVLPGLPSDERPARSPP